MSRCDFEVDRYADVEEEEVLLLLGMSHEQLKMKGCLCPTSDLCSSKKREAHFESRNRDGGGSVFDWLRFHNSVLPFPFSCPLDPVPFGLRQPDLRLNLTNPDKLEVPSQVQLR